MALILRSGVEGRAARWVVITLVIAAAVWVVAFAGLLKVAKEIHADIPHALALKLPLLRSQPDLIFAGESRTEYQVDPVLASKMTGRRPGAAVNIAYDAGEPLAVLAAVREQPDLFRGAHLVISVAPFLFNEGVRSAAVYPLDVVARLGVLEQFATFVPLRIGTLFRFIRDAFNARLALKQEMATHGPAPAAYGLSIIQTQQSDNRWPQDLGSHSHYAAWNLSGPKARFEIGALCDLAPLVRKLTVVIPPWAPRYERSSDAQWRAKDGQYVALLEGAGQRCGFHVLDIQAVPGLGQSNYADEMHVISSGVPIYTRYLVTLLQR